MGTTKNLGADSVLQELSELALWLCKNKASGGPLSWRKEANRVSFMAKVWSHPRYVVDCGAEVGEICIGGQGPYLNERGLRLLLSWGLTLFYTS